MTSAVAQEWCKLTGHVASSMPETTAWQQLIIWQENTAEYQTFKLRVIVHSRAIGQNVAFLAAAHAFVLVFAFGVGIRHEAHSQCGRLAVRTEGCWPCRSVKLFLHTCALYACLWGCLRTVVISLCTLVVIVVVVLSACLGMAPPRVALLAALAEGVALRCGGFGRCWRWRWCALVTS